MNSLINLFTDDFLNLRGQFWITSNKEMVKNVQIDVWKGNVNSQSTYIEFSGNHRIGYC